MGLGHSPCELEKVAFAQARAHLEHGRGDLDVVAGQAVGNGVRGVLPGGHPARQAGALLLVAAVEEAHDDVAIEFELGRRVLPDPIEKQVGNTLQQAAACFRGRVFCELQQRIKHR